MNDELEKMYSSFMNNLLPLKWANAAYPSMKTLGSWVKDLQLRCDFIGVITSFFLNITQSIKI